MNYDKTNTKTGTNAGETLSDGSSYNIAIGQNSGPRDKKVYTKRLWIDILQTDRPLIAGNFGTPRKVDIWGDLEVHGEVSFAVGNSISVTDPIQKTGSTIALKYDSDDLGVDATGKLYVKAIPSGNTATNPISLTAGAIGLKYDTDDFGVDGTGKLYSKIVPGTITVSDPISLAAGVAGLKYDPADFSLDGTGRLKANTSPGVADHGALTGLADDDHTQYLRADATRGLSADWDIGNLRMIKADRMVARDADGLALYEDGGQGVFIHDGGVVDITGKLRLISEVYFYVEVDNGANNFINWTLGNRQKATLTSSVTYSFTNPTGICNLVLRVIQGGSGNNHITWPATVKWADGIAPTLSTAAGKVDIITFYWNGTNYYGAAIVGYST